MLADPEGAAASELVAVGLGFPDLLRGLFCGSCNNENRDSDEPRLGQNSSPCGDGLRGAMNWVVSRAGERSKPSRR